MCAQVIFPTRLPMTDRDFAYISELMGRRVGINLTERKRELVYGRLSSRIRALGMGSFREYCDRLASGDEQEIARCINSLTTNVTRFFREDHHFTFLREWFREREAAAAQGREDRSLRIWSAGCSSGEEPYSIAISLLDSGVDLRRWRIELLATDVDTNMLEKARRGIYPATVLNEMATPERWFLRGVNGNDGQVRVKPALRSMLELGPLNLLGDWPALGTFDLIFCRNVIIYFTAENRLRLIGRFAERLAVGSHLILGHSESIHGMGDRFEIVGRTINRKVA